MKDSEVTSVVCCVALEEEDYIAEWISYHLLLGFDAIYIYDNSADNTLLNYHGMHQGRVSVIHFPGKVKQSDSYNHFLKANKGSYTFAAFIDCDEFIVLKKTQNINRFLEGKNIEAGLAINWSMFGSNFRESRGAGGVLQRFLRRSASLDDVVKCIVRLENVDEYSHPHCPTRKRGEVRDAAGKVVKEWSNPDGNDSEIVIFHFWTKSKEEFFRKVARGRADTMEKRAEPLVSFYEFNLRANLVFDDTALRFIEANGADMPGATPMLHQENLPVEVLMEAPYSDREKQMLELLEYAAAKLGPIGLWDLQELIQASIAGEHPRHNDYIKSLRIRYQEVENKNKELEDLLRLERERSDQAQSKICSLEAEIEDLQRVQNSFANWQKLPWIKRAFTKWEAPVQKGPG